MYPILLHSLRTLISPLNFFPSIHCSRPRPDIPLPKLLHDNETRFQFKEGKKETTDSFLPFGFRANPSFANTTRTVLNPGAKYSNLSIKNTAGDIGTARVFILELKSITNH